MAKATLPVAIHIGTTPVGVAHIELPIVATPAGRDAAGLWQVNVAIDHAELRRRIADILRSAADEIEKGVTDG